MLSTQPASFYATGIGDDKPGCDVEPSREDDLRGERKRPAGSKVNTS